MTVVRIPKNQLRKGMYVESVECPDADFSKRRFLLDLDEDLEAIAAAPAEYVVVNISRGRGLNGALPQKKPLPEAREPDEQKIRRAAETITRSTGAVKAGFANFVSDGHRILDDLTPVSRELKERMEEGPAVLLEMTRLKTKDEGTFVHSIAVGALMTSVGRAVGYDEATVEMLGVAGLLHDCGKLLIPNVILNKKGSLSDVERQIIRYHHEFLDGSGYPLGLKGDALSGFVRLSTICDVYDALTSVRPYKKAWTGKQAIAWMFEQGDRFDRKLLLRLDQITSE